MEKIEVKEAKGKLGILVVGVGGAVATTMITGTLAARKGLAKPIGSISQLATMRLENGEEKAIKDIVPLTDLNDIVFGGWDIFPDNAYEAAIYAEVLKEKDLNGVKDELEAIKPMPAAFDHNWAKRLNGTHIKQAATRWDMVEQLRQDIREFKAATTVFLSNGVPIETVSSMLGHKSIKTTQIYAKITKEKLNQDMENLAARLNQIEEFAGCTI